MGLLRDMRRAARRWCDSNDRRILPKISLQILRSAQRIATRAVAESDVENLVGPGMATCPAFVVGEGLITVRRTTLGWRRRH